MRGLKSHMLLNARLRRDAPAFSRRSLSIPEHWHNWTLAGVGLGYLGTG